MSKKIILIILCLAAFKIKCAESPCISRFAQTPSRGLLPFRDLPADKEADFHEQEVAIRRTILKYLCKANIDYANKRLKIDNDKLAKIDMRIVGYQARINPDKRSETDIVIAKADKVIARQLRVTQKLKNVLEEYAKNTIRYHY